MKNGNQAIWKPDQSDIELMQIMHKLSVTYDDYYIMKYGRALGQLFEWLYLANARIACDYCLFESDRDKYISLKKKLQPRMESLLNPRFLPGQLAVLKHDQSEKLCTVISRPYVSELNEIIACDVLVEGSLMVAPINKLKMPKRTKASSLT